MGRRAGGNARNKGLGHSGRDRLLGYNQEKVYRTH